MILGPDGKPYRRPEPQDCSRWPLRRFTLRASANGFPGWRVPLSALTWWAPRFRPRG